MISLRVPGSGSLFFLSFVRKHVDRGGGGHAPVYGAEANVQVQPCVLRDRQGLKEGEGRDYKCLHTGMCVPLQMLRLKEKQFKRGKKELWLSMP